MKISFCIPTNGKRPDKINLCVKSIEYAGGNDIILAGNIKDSIPGTKYVPSNKIEYVGHNRNLAAEQAKGDILVFMDDDILLSTTFIQRLEEFTENVDWDVLGCKVLLPCGNRYWDKNTYLPNHLMVSYDHDFTENEKWYQNSALFIIKKDIWNKHKWDNNILYYHNNKDDKQLNEDVEYSFRLQELGYQLTFDDNNLAWHFDTNFISDNYTCSREENKNKFKDEFVLLLEKLECCI